MRVRPLILVVTIYMGLDLTNPFMPGAFIFDPEQSVEGVHGEQGRQQFLAMATPATPRVKKDEAPAPPRRPAPVARQWLAEPRPAHVPASDPPPVSEDH